MIIKEILSSLSSPCSAYTTRSRPAVEYFLWQVLAHTKTRYLLRPPLILLWLLATEINIILRGEEAVPWEISDMRKYW